MRTPETPGPRPWLPFVLVLGMGAAAGTTAPRLLPAAASPDASRPVQPGAADSHGPSASSLDSSAQLRPVLTLIGEALGRPPEPPGGTPPAKPAEAAQAASADDALRDRLRARATATAVDIDFVVAGIADYVDSNVGWYADQHLEAIQAAMVTAGYTFDRFYLPDWPRERSGAAAHLHRQTPGAIIFRGRRSPEGRTPLRVVLLVPETPTAGFHRGALQGALTLAHTWHPGATSELRILGPTFSGSIESLRRVLREDPAIWRTRRVRVVSGTAAAASNRDALEVGSEAESAVEGEVNGEPMVSYETTTHPFPEWLRSLRRYLAGVDPKWADGDGMAVLHESNTTFGSESAGLLGTFPHAKSIAFPLHVSRLRDATADAVMPAARPGLLSRALLPLTSREPITPSDQLPSLTPELTNAAVQTTMAALFDALRHERFRLVVIIATDERDSIYLAREVRRASPDTQLAFFGTHMLLLHPDYASYTRGGLVVSSYPLTPSVTNWGIGEPTRGRRHFPSWSAEGLYNAALVLTDHHKLVDYAVPVVNTTERVGGPPVWITTVGRTGFVPLAAYAADANSTFLHLHPLPEEEAARSLAVPLPGLLLVAACLLAFLWHAWVVVRQVSDFFRRPKLVRCAVQVSVAKPWWHVAHRRHPDRLRQKLSEADQAFNEVAGERQAWIEGLQEQRVTGYSRVFVLPWRPVDVRRTAAMFVHAAFGVFGLVLAWWALLLVRAGGSADYVPAIAAGLAAAAVPVLLAITGHTGAPSPRRPGAHKQGYAFAWIVAVALLLAVPALAYLWGPLPRAASTVLPFAPLMMAERGFALTSLVSPTVPIICFALCAYIWLVWQLRVLSFVGGGFETLFDATMDAPAAAVQERAMAAAQAIATPGSPPAPAGTSMAESSSPSAADAASAVSVPVTVSVPNPGPPPVVPAAAPAGESGRITRGAPTMMSLLLAGEIGAPATSSQAGLARWRAAFTGAFDSTLPTREQWHPLAIALLAVALVAPVVWLRTYTLEGPRFTGLFRVATLGGLFLGTLALAQTYLQWRQVGGALARVGRSPLAPAFSKVRGLHFDWRLSLALPRRDELALLLVETDALEKLLDTASSPPADVPLTSERALKEKIGRELLTSSGLKGDGVSLADVLEQEHHADHLRLLGTHAFDQVWARTQRYLPLLHRWFEAEGRTPDRPPSTSAAGQSGLDWAAVDWFERAQRAVALTQAFAIRDLLSRIAAGLGVGCACFVLLLVAHLFYAFPGRSTLLVIDWIAVGLAGALAVSILVAMERSVVLSHLWGSDPGRISFNRDFVQRLAIYGALPVLTLVSALFPEMGDTIFSWLAPARQVAGF